METNQFNNNAYQSLKDRTVNVVGGGLAGTEIAYQLGRRGISVRLFEMRPAKMTPAHSTGDLAELVCSNSFKSVADHSAHAGFKREMASLGSLLIQCAEKARVPAGESLAVDREHFSKEMTEGVLATGCVERIQCTVSDPSDLPPADATVLATGPLTHGGLATWMAQLAGSEKLYFYDAIAPVVHAESLDRSIIFSASRYGRGGDDFLNCPMTKEEYNLFYDALMAAEKMAFHDFEEGQYFQGCQPIEAIAETGRETLRFGPMKPVGLTDPRTGKRPYACVQLRIDNLSRSAYNLVGFQTKLKYGEQSRIFRLIPGLQNAEFLRLGSMHRNTYLASPILLNHDFSLKGFPSLYVAGQMMGVEGYTESSAMGLLVSLSLLSKFSQGEAGWELPPRDSFMGALCHYLFHSPLDEFQPVNVHFGLFREEFKTLGEGELGKQARDRRLLRTWMVNKALENFGEWRDKMRRRIGEF